MDSPTPPYLDRQRKTLKRSRLFEDAMYAGKPLRAQSQTLDVIEVVGGQEMITQQQQALVDWIDLDHEPADGDVLRFIKRDVAYEIVSYKLQGDGFCRLVLQRP